MAGFPWTGPSVRCAEKVKMFFTSLNVVLKLIIVVIIAAVGIIAGTSAIDWIEDADVRRSMKEIRDDKIKN